MTSTTTPTAITTITAPTAPLSQQEFIDLLADACVGYSLIDLPAQAICGRRYLEFGAILICLHDTGIEAGYGPLVEAIGRGRYDYTVDDARALASDLKEALATATQYGVTAMGERGFTNVVLEIVDAYAGDDVPLVYLMRALSTRFTPTLDNGRYGRRHVGFDLVMIASLLRAKGLTFVPFHECVANDTCDNDDEMWLPIGWTTTLGKNYGALRKGTLYQNSARCSIPLFR